MWLKAGSRGGSWVGSGPSPSGGISGLMYGAKGRKKAVVSSPKCRLNSAELAAAARAFFSGASSSLIGSSLASSL